MARPASAPRAMGCLSDAAFDAWETGAGCEAAWAAVAELKKVDAKALCEARTKRDVILRSGMELDVDRWHTDGVLEITCVPSSPRFNAGELVPADDATGMAAGASPGGFMYAMTHTDMHGRPLRVRVARVGERVSARCAACVGHREAAHARAERHRLRRRGAV